jgi:hypothetical protein
MKKSASEQLLKFGESIRESINCAKTGTVEKVSGKFADIKLKSGQVLAEVPVFKFGTGTDRGLKLPLKKGDTGLLLFFDHNIDAFQNSAEKDNEVHNHDISDCLFIPGFLPDKQRNDNQDNVVLENGSMSIELSDGKIKITGGTKEMLTIIESFMDNAINTMDSMINDAFLIAAGGGSGSFSAALKDEWILPVTGLKALLERNKSDLGGMKL